MTYILEENEEGVRVCIGQQSIKKNKEQANSLSSTFHIFRYMACSSYLIAIKNHQKETPKYKKTAEMDCVQKLK